MAIVKLPRAPKSAGDQRRVVSTLLKNQILHLQEAEFRLPAEFQTNIYIHAIRTERDAGEYIRQVTEAIHAAHGAGVKPKPKAKPERTFAIAAAAATPRKKKKTKTVGKKKSTKRRPTK